MSVLREDILLILLRISMGFIFLWAFLDKLFGLGFATKAENAWLLGNSPTYGFLKMATHGPFKPFFEGLAGNAFVDWSFMLGLLLIGAALLLGICMKLASYAGLLLMLLMWLALVPPQNNPVIDDHIIYALVLLLLAVKRTGRMFGLGNWWNNTQLVKNNQWLE